VVIIPCHGEAWLRRRGSEAPERSRRPEALPGFIRRSEMRSQGKRGRAGHAGQAVRSKPFARARPVRPHVALNARDDGGRRSATDRLRAPIIGQPFCASAATETLWPGAVRKILAIVAGEKHCHRTQRLPPPGRFVPRPAKDAADRLPGRRCRVLSCPTAGLSRCAPAAKTMNVNDCGLGGTTRRQQCVRSG